MNRTLWSPVYLFSKNQPTHIIIIILPIYWLPIIIVQEPAAAAAEPAIAPIKIEHNEASKNAFHAKMNAMHLKHMKAEKDEKTNLIVHNPSDDEEEPYNQ